MFEAMTLAMKMSEVLKTVDYLADQIDASIIIDWKGTCDNYEKLNDKVHYP